MSEAMRPMSLGEILDRTFTLYRRHFLLFVTIMAVPQVVILGANLIPELMKGWAATPGSPSSVLFGLLGALGILFLVVIFYVMLAVGQAATVVAVSEITLGRQTTAQAAYARISGRVWRMVNVLFSTGVRIILGFILLVIPGILLVVRYSVAIPAAILEDLKARDAIRRSVSLTEGRRGDAFLILFVTFVLSWIASALFTFPISFAVAFSARAGEPSIWLNMLMHASTFLAGVLVGPIGTIALALYYYDCRVRKEAFDLQVMLASLESAPGNPAGAPANQA